MKIPINFYAFVVVMLVALSACEVNEVLPNPHNDQGVKTNNTSDHGGGGDDEEPIIHFCDSASTQCP